MAEVTVLVVTSSGAPPAAVVPVLAAIEAAGLRVRAIDLGGAGGGGGGMADRVRRALLGEGAERRLKKELELATPDAAVVFDPHAAQALTVARDQMPLVAGSPPPVIGVVADLEPAGAWAQTDCDRFVAVDELAAVALADAGVEGDRILIVGAIGERMFAEAALQDRAALRTRFKLTGKVALVEVGGLGAEATGSLALQLSLLDGGETIQFLFDAAGDADAAAVLRRQVPALGLRAKLFGATPDSALLWRAADVIVARPRSETVARVLLVGGKLVALVDDTVEGAARAAAALETRKRAIAAKGLLLLASALDSAFGGSPPAPTPDGADMIADIVAAVAGDKRGVIDERRVAAQAATRDRVRAATSAAQAAAASAAMPGELEDLSGATAAPASAFVVDRAELERLRNEVALRVTEMTKSMAAARDAATKLSAEARTTTGDEASQLDRRADAERARMHGLLAELATLESELKELERAIAALPKDMPRAKPPASAPGEPVRAAPTRSGSLDDALADLKRRAGTTGGGASSSTSSGSGPTPPRADPKKPPRGGTVEDELAALKRKMAAAPPKKKP